MAAGEQDNADHFDDQEKSIDGDSTGSKAATPAEKAAPASNSGPPPVPNGGLQAWLQVLGAWFLFFNTFGILNTFGVYQTYYESGDLFVTSSSNISWIGAVQSFVLLLCGVFVGPIFDRGYFRALLIFGSFLIVLGHMMLSLCHEFWQVILAQGFAIGIGAGCLFVPGIAIIPSYFSTKIGLAMGLAASGSSTGGIIYPIMFYKLISEIGFGWAVRILGFTVLATQVIAIAVLKQRVRPAKPRSLIDTTVFSDFPFMLFTLGATIGFIGLYVGLFYLSYFGEATGLTDASLSFYLVPILNAGSVFGRTLPNWLADHLGPTNVMTPGAVIVGILLLCLLAVKSAAGLIVITAFFGFFSGIYVALPPVLFVALTKDKSKIGTRIGMGFAFVGLGTLAGGPGAGGILGTNENDLNWSGVWIYGGVCTLASAVIFTVVRTMRVGPKLKVKV